MKRALLFSAALLLCCSSPAAAQETGRTPSSDGAALRRALLRLPPPTLGELVPEEPLVREQTISFRPPDAEPARTPVETWLQGISTIYETALNQRRRFDYTGQTMAFERSGLYFRRDLYSTTKGVILYHTWQDRIDIGLYKRRLDGVGAQLTTTAEQFGWCTHSNKSFVLGGNRQIFVGVRLNLDKIFY